MRVRGKDRSPRHDKDGAGSDGAGRPESRHRESPTPLLGWILGPAAWALQHAMGYAMIPWLCDAGLTWPYHALIGICVALCGLGAGAAWSAARSARNAPSRQTGDRLRFMARGGYILSGGAVTAILIAYGGAVWIGLCQGQ